MQFKCETTKQLNTLIVYVVLIYKHFSTSRIIIVLISDNFNLNAKLKDT